MTTTNVTSNYKAKLQQGVVQRVAENAPKNLWEKMQYLHQVIHNREPRENTNLNSKIDFALLSKKSYEKTRQDREVPGFSIVPDMTTDDRTVYYHHETGKAVIAFRGTDPHDWGHGTKGFFHSRGFRDVTTDVLLGSAEQNQSHRFANAERVTEAAIKRFGHENVIATGHSLGGSQAMHVSNKYGIHAEAYNPHVDWLAAMSRANYYNTALHVNKTDPVAALYPYATFQSVDARYNKKAKPFIAQHGIDNFLNPAVKSKPIPSSGMGGISQYMNRPAPTPVQTAQQSVTPHHPKYLDCSHMPQYMQIQYGCRSIKPRRGFTAQA